VCPVRFAVKKVLGLFQLGDWRKKKNAPFAGRVFLLDSHLVVYGVLVKMRPASKLSSVSCARRSFPGVSKLVSTSAIPSGD